MSLDIALQRIEECKRKEATHLDLSLLELTQVPETIVYLTNLTSLDLKQNRIFALPATLDRLTKLTVLNLSENDLKVFPEQVTFFPTLNNLNLSKNNLSYIPKTIKRLTALTHLNLSSNFISEFPESVTLLSSLTVLNMWNNKIPSLPESIARLTLLTILNLWNNRLTTLPDSISQLSNLRLLDVSRNRLTSLPYSLTDLHRLQTLNLKENSDLSIPIEVLKDTKNITSIFDYIRANRQARPVLLNEVKVLIIGEAEVGKTTLVRRLLDEEVNIEKRDPTPGIVVRDDKLMVKGREMLVHFWDFGGQEIMHNTHRLFLTTRSCYLLVLDATQNEEANKVIEWLKTIHIYAPDAPVILVINKWDKFKLRLNVPALEQHHPIASIIETSCATREGIERLRDTIQQELGTLKHLDDEIPAKWMEVRKQVGEENKDYLEYEEFERMCAANGVTEGMHVSVADLLHALGVLFTYSNDRTTKLTHVLNPNWVTGGIYPILNDPELLQGRGFVTDGDIERVLLPKEYRRDKHPFILSMMFVFELAYELERARYLVPDLLPKSPPKYQWKDKGALRFVFHYDFIPPGLFSRFVVRMRDEVNPEEVWRTGVILHQHNAPYGRVVVDTDAKRIEIAIALPEGDHRDPRTLLDTLRDKFQRLHDDYAGVEVQELVPIGDTFVDYADLLFWAERGNYKQSSRLAGDFDVRELLQGISARMPSFGSPEKKIVTDKGVRRKRLVEILIREFPSPTHLEDFLYFEELEAYLAEIHWNAPIRDVSREVVRTLERAGVVPDSGISVLGILLQALAEKASGHPNDVAFLRAWAREVG